MARFEVLEQEGTRFVKITLENETVQAEAGALSSMTGNLVMDVPLPSFGRMLKSYLSEESYIRPTYSGIGILQLESSLGGFHVFEVGGETWLLDSGTYWASEASVQVSAIREKAWVSFWSGEGLIDWQTKVAGHGKVALTSKGPVEEVALETGERFVDTGKCVIGRSKSVAYSLTRPAKSLLKTYMSGERYCRAYEGPGRLLISSVPYWRLSLVAPDGGSPHTVAAA